MDIDVIILMETLQTVMTSLPFSGAVAGGQQILYDAVMMMGSAITKSAVVRRNLSS